MASSFWWTKDNGYAQEIWRRTHHACLAVGSPVNRLPGECWLAAVGTFQMDDSPATPRSKTHTQQKRCPLCMSGSEKSHGWVTTVITLLHFIPQCSWMLNSNWFQVYINMLILLRYWFCSNDLQRDLWQTENMCKCWYDKIWHFWKDSPVSNLSNSKK